MPSLSTRNLALELGVAPIVSGQAALSGLGALSAGRALKVLGASTLTGAGTPSVGSLLRRLGAAALTGAGTIAAYGNKLMPPIRTLVEGFDGPTIDSARWPSGSNTYIENGRLVLPVTLVAPSSSIGGSNVVGPFYRLKGSQIVLRVWAPDVYPGFDGTFVSFQLIAEDGSQRLGWIVRRADGKIAYQQSAPDGSVSAYSEETYDPVAHAWWRVREAGGSVFVETSVDATAWDLKLTYATPLGADSVWLALGAEMWGVEEEAVLVDFINQTVGAATLSGAGTLSASGTVVHPKFSTLVDDFASAIDYARWPFHFRDSWEAGRAKLPLQTGGSGSYIGQNSTSGPFHDLTGSSIFAQLEIPPTPASNRAMTFSVNRVGGYTTAARFTRDRFGSLIASQLVSNANTDSLSLPYDPIAHAWLRIRESGGTLYWDVSPDGSAWTNFLSAPLRFDATQMHAVFNPLSSNEAAPTSWVYVDNVNVVPAAVWSGAAGLTGVGSALVAGTTRRSGTAALSGLGSSTLAGRRTASGTALLSGLGSLAAAGRSTVRGAAALSGLGSSTAVPLRRARSAAAASGTGSLSAGFRRAVLAPAAVGGLGTLAAAGRSSVRGAAALAGQGSQFVSSIDAHIGFAALAGHGSLSASGLRRIPSAVVARPVGSASGTAAAATLQIVLTGPVAVGETILVRVCQDYTSGAPTMTDVKGNVYVRDRTSAFADAVGTNQLRSSTFRCFVANALSLGEVLTVTFSQSITNRLGAAEAVGGLLNAVDGQNGYTHTATGGVVDGTAFTTTSAAATFLYAAFYALGPASDAMESDAGFERLSRAGVGSRATVDGGTTTVYQSGSYFYRVKLPDGARFQLHLISYELAALPGVGYGWDGLIAELGATAYYKLDEPAGSFVDRRGALAPGVVSGSVGRHAGSPVADAPGGAVVFSGAAGNYVEIADDDRLSVATTGAMTIAVWLRPDTLNNPITEGQDPPPGEGLYIHWLGKGENDVENRYEYMARMYDKSLGGNPANGDNLRPNRLSGYHFNPPGGLGSGSYFQDALVVGQWLLYVLRFNATGPAIWRDGTWRDSDFFSDYSIVPQNTSAPFRLGTVVKDSWLQGAIGPLALWNRALSSEEIYRLALAAPETSGSAAAVLAGTGSLVAARLRKAVGAVALAGLGTSSQSGLRRARSAALASGQGVLVAAPLRRALAAAAPTGVGSLAAAGLRLVRSGTVLASGQGSCVAAGTRVAVGGSTLSGQGQLAALSLRVARSAAALVGTGLAEASWGIGTWLGRAPLAGTGALAAGATRITRSAASSAGFGSLLAAAIRVRISSSALHGLGVCTAVALRLRPGKATLAGSGTLAGAGRRRVPSAAVLLGRGDLQAAWGTPRWSSSAPLAGVGSAAATPLRVVAGRASPAGLGGLSASSYAIGRRSSTLAGAGSLAGRGVRVRSSAAALSGRGSLSGEAAARPEGGALLTGAGLLVAWPAEPLRAPSAAPELSRGDLGYMRELGTPGGLRGGGGRGHMQELGRTGRVGAAKSGKLTKV